VVVGWFPFCAGDGFEDVKVVLEGCGRVAENGLVENAGASLTLTGVGISEIPYWLPGDGTREDSQSGVLVDGTTDSENGVQDVEEFLIPSRSSLGGVTGFFGLGGEAGDDVETADPAAEGAEGGSFVTNPHLGEEDAGVGVFAVGESGRDAGGEVVALCLRG
jgi:hypothetical protein